MPEHPCRDRSPGTPAVRDPADPLEARRRSHPLHLAERRDQREVAVRPDVSSAECHQEIDVGGPRADALQPDQCRVGVVIVHTGKRARIELARNDRLSELADVPALLSGQPGASQGRLVESGDGLRCHRARGPLEPSVGRSACRERHLLLEDDLNEGLESWCAIPQRRRPEPFDDARQMLVAPCELGNTVPERLRCELNGHVIQTRRPTLL